MIPSRVGRIQVSGQITLSFVWSAYQPDRNFNAEFLDMHPVSYPTVCMKAAFHPIPA
jgi:hypothetical protein